MLLRGRTTLIRKGSDPAAVPEAARGVLLVAGVELVFVAQGPGGCAVVAVYCVDVPVFAVLVYGADVVAGVQFCEWLGLWQGGKCGVRGLHTVHAVEVDTGAVGGWVADEFDVEGVVVCCFLLFWQSDCVGAGDGGDCGEDRGEVGEVEHCGFLGEVC